MNENQNIRLYYIIYFCSKQIISDKTINLIIEDCQKWVEIDARNEFMKST